MYILYIPNYKKKSYLDTLFHILQKTNTSTNCKMGNNKSKGSTNITSTPNKEPVPAVENGKNVDEEIIADEKIIRDDPTKVQNLLSFSHFLFLLKLFKSL